MAECVLIVCEPLHSLRERKTYWRNYIDFYEKYWDSPSSPQSAWWAREYEKFRNSLSREMGIDRDEIRDCFFIKENDKYYISPVGSEVNLNIFACEGYVPPEWFVLFKGDERDFYTLTPDVEEKLTFTHKFKSN